MDFSVHAYLYKLDFQSVQVKSWKTQMQVKNKANIYKKW